MAAFYGESNENHDQQSLSGRFKKFQLVKEEYQKQKKIWPQSGRHILAHFDDETIVVYQAYNPKIASHAVKYQRFGGPDFSFDRMSWIKTNFMWMMFRCGWAQKRNQERVLAVWLTRDGFEQILAKASTAKQSADVAKTDEVRLQWDPDHNPQGEKMSRRAIQLGLRGKSLQDYATRYIVGIQDITAFVHEQFKGVIANDESCSLLCPRERIYTPHEDSTCARIELDFISQQTVVGFTS